MKSVKQFSIVQFLRNNSAFIVFVALFAFAAIRYDSFLSVPYIKNLFVQNSMIGLLAFGMTFVIIAGDIDLSVGANMAFCGIIAAKMSTQNIFLTVTVVLVLGIAIGLLNGFMVTKMDIVPFIATLATQVGVRGIVYIITDYRSVPTTGCTEAFKSIGHGSLIPGVPNPVLILFAIFFLCFFVLKYTKYGRHNFAVGGNLSAAKMMGIRSSYIRICNFAISGFMTGLAGLLIASRLGSGQYSAGDGWEMNAIAATVIGGTLLTGGVGGVSGTFFGVLILGVINMIFNLQGNLNIWWQNIATGVILLGVVMVQSRVQKKSAI